MNGPYKAKLTAMLVATSTFVVAYAANAAEVEVINNTGENIQVFFRGEGSKKHRVETLAVNTTGTYTLIEEELDGKPVFEVIVSTGNQGNPDLKFLGGTCSHLDKNGKHKVLIEKTKMGFKTSCEKL